MLLGVNIGPNLTYTGSLATLLWRRVLRESGTEVSLGRVHPAGGGHRDPGPGSCPLLCLWLALRV